jgi:hypothetical protein
MSYDLYFGGRNPDAILDMDAVRAWFLARGYTIEHPLQAGKMTGDDDLLWDFGFFREVDTEFDRPLLAHCSLPSSASDMKICTRDALEFCEANDLLVCDPQTESLHFMEPREYLISPDGLGN